MRFIAVGLVVLGFGTCAGAVDIEQQANAVEADVIEWRRHFHQYPELSNREFETAAYIARFLESLDIEVQTGVAHTGVIGVLRGSKPGATVALRADMDALPVPERNDLPFRSQAKGLYNGEEVDVMHACGHDTHMAMLMGAASILADARDQLAGTVVFIFQPAEEGSPLGEEGGAELMVKEGVLRDHNVDVAFGIHISANRDVGSVTYRPGGMMAGVDDFQILIHGKQTHGSRPWSGIDPIVTAAQMINALQTIVSREVPLTENAAVVSVGKIRAGVRSNIIPESAELVGTIRTLDTDHRELILAAIHRKAEAIAAGMRATVEVKVPYSSSYPVTYNDPELTAKMVPTLNAVAGAENVKVVDAITGAEDFSFFAREVPGLYVFVGGKPLDTPTEESAPHHTPDFFIDESGMKTGVKVYAALAMDYLKANADE